MLILICDICDMSIDFWNYLLTNKYLEKKIYLSLWEKKLKPIVVPICIDLLSESQVCIFFVLYIILTLARLAYKNLQMSAHNYIILFNFCLLIRQLSGRLQDKESVDTSSLDKKSNGVRSNICYTRALSDHVLTTTSTLYGT